MEILNGIDWTGITIALLTAMGVAFGLAILLLIFIIWQVRKIELPENADFMTTLRATPLIVVLFLDLLDFSLDFFAAPFAWIVLSRLGLAQLRMVTTVETLIPGTQFLPTMTAAWIFARFTKDRELPGLDI
ncbi:MAG: hypothetical protein AAF485_30555 [Chloroflexota bacterium]